MNCRLFDFETLPSQVYLHKMYEIMQLFFFILEKMKNVALNFGKKKNNNLQNLKPQILPISHLKTQCCQVVLKIETGFYLEQNWTELGPETV